MKRVASRAAAVLLPLAIVLGSAPARADGAPQAALAEKLFRDGRKLLSEGKLREACESFGESRRLDPTPGTLLNLGSCLEDLGRTASAWATYGELAARASRLGQTARAQFATEKVAELLPKMPTLEIRLVSDHRIDGLTIECDGTVLGNASLGTRVPVDPGPHEVTARAPGRVAWRSSVEARPAQSTRVDVPLLAPDGGSGDTSAAAGGASTTMPPSSSPLRTTGVVLALVGAAATATGLVLGGVAKVTDDGANRDGCVAAGCPADTVARIRRADDYATASTVVTVGGLALAAAGLALWVFAPSSKRAASTNVLSATLASLTVGGTF